MLKQTLKSVALAAVLAGSAVAAQAQDCLLYTSDAADELT